MAALGRVVSKRSAAAEIDNGAGGRGWVWQSGNVLVMSDSIEALARGAMLALDARRAPGSEDVTAVLYPDTIARANGTDLKSAVSRLLAETDAAQGNGSGGLPGAPSADLVDMLQDLVSYLGDTDAVELGLAMDGTRGLIVSARLRPNPGTALEKVIAEVHTFELDPALLRGAGEIAFAFASGDGPFVRSQIARQRQRLQVSPDKGAASALQFFDASTAAIAGECSGVGRIKPRLSAQFSCPLKDPAAAKKVSEAMQRMDQKAALALLKAQGKAPVGPFDWRIKKETVGKLRTLHYTLALSLKSMSRSVRDAVKKVIGEPALDMYFAVSGTRLVTTVGKDAKTALKAMGDGSTAGKSAGKSETKDQPKGALADALAASKGRASFGFLDLGSVLGILASFSDDPRAASLARGQSPSIPIYGTFATDAPGKVMTFAVTIPPAAFAGAGAIFQAGGVGMIR
jgi:hypothetical protein